MKLGDLFIKLGLQKGEFDKGIDDAKRKTSAFGDGMKKIGGMIAGVFAVGQVVSYVRESMKLAAETENVRKAFIRLGGGAYFNDLNNAVRGTLSQVDLMKNTIQATNFGIPIKDLANLFKFATERAAQTGQSVEYLTQSIVMGIGRKSVLILDNLGISAVQLREKLKKVGEEAATVGDVAEAIGEIAQEQFKRMGEQATTTAQKLDDVKGSWVDIKVAIGDAINQSDIFTGGIKIIGDYLNVFSAQTANAMTNAGNRVKKFMATMPESIADQKTAIKAELDRLNEEIAQYQAGLETNPKLAWSMFPTPERDKVKQEINTLKNQAIELAGVFDQLKMKSEPVELMQRISDLELLISMEKKLASQKNISADDAINHANAIAKAEEELKKLREIAGVEAHKTSVEQLADLKKVNDELEAQRILRQEFKGEKIQPMTPLYQGVGDLTLPQQSDTGGVFGNLDSHYKMTKDKFDKFTEEYNADGNAFVDELNQTLANGIADAISTMSSGFADLAIGDIGIAEFGKNILAVIGQFLVQMGEMLIAYGIGMDAFKKAFTNPWAAIAAGAALVFIGSAISGFAKAGPGGSGGGAVAASGYSNYSASSGAAVLSGNVVFELEGTKLRGALNNTDRRNTLIR